MKSILISAVVAGLMAMVSSGCSTSKAPTPATQPSAGVLADGPESARAAVYRHDVSPGYGSPEALNAYLEQRWPLEKIRAACTAENLATGMKQDLVLDYGQSWKGRLYEDRDTGFDKISWYASVLNGRLMSYSLHAVKGNQCWMIGGGSPSP